MSGIYIHIPFCRKACHYCNFHFSTNLSRKQSMVDAICKEIRSAPLPIGRPMPAAIDSIYFGGGTPSLLDWADLQAMLQAVHERYEVSPTAEVTLETNPDDHRQERLEQWQAVGINRLSIGVQSFFEEDLLWMNRAHDAAASVACITAAKAAGFEHLTIDLIYGTPGLTHERWLQNLEQAMALGVNHLSCYALTVEPKTALDAQIKQGKLADVDGDVQAEQFLLLMDRMATAGWEHYEISNFARPGHRSRHNSSYWQGKPYRGYGPSAHSFDGDRTRWWNVANNSLYLSAMEQGSLCHEHEALTDVQQQNEYIMTGLRTMEGIERYRYEALTGEAGSFDALLAKARPWISGGQLLASPDRLWLTREGKLLADGVAAGIFG